MTMKQNDDVAVEIKNLCKEYKNTTALDNISLTVSNSTFYCIVGPNGSGKSTLFRILLDLTNKSSGEVIFSDNMTIGCAFQEPCFYPELSVQENINVFKSITGANDPEWIGYMIEKLGLNRVSSRKASNISGGYSKKLDIALGMINKPDLFLLDEPLADLDDVSRTELVHFLKEYTNDGNTVLISTHNVEKFADVLDHLTIMDTGKIELDVHADELTTQENELHQMYVDMVSDVETKITPDDIAETYND